MSNATVWQDITQETAKFGLPLDWASALIWSESGGDPSASNGAHYGLLQLSPDYNGHHTPGELVDPMRNLEIGLGPVSQAYKAGQAQGLSDQHLWDYTLTHSGHDQWTGHYSTPTSQAYFDQAYAQRGLDQTRLQLKTGNAFDLGGGGIGQAAGLPPIAENATVAKDQAKYGEGPLAFMGDIGAGLHDLMNSPALLVVALAALIVFAGTGLHMVRNA